MLKACTSNLSGVLVHALSKVLSEELVLAGISADSTADVVVVIVEQYLLLGDG